MQEMNVLLLRQSEGNSDKYHSRFQTPIISNVNSLPVLSFEFCNLDKVKEFVENFDSYSGLIVTSKRSIEAFQQTINDVQLERLRNAKHFNIYVVGQGSSDCLEKMNLPSIGAETGNAQDLSTTIIRQEQTSSKPLMFLCGNLARETITNRLRESSIPLESISCYKTVADKCFEEKLAVYLSEHDAPHVVVFFSPSGAKFHLNTLKTLVRCWKNVSIVCIGDTTRDALTEMGEIVRSVATKPSPDGLYEAVERISDDIL